jgi:hypothetical protein
MARDYKNHGGIESKEEAHAMTLIYKRRSVAELSAFFLPSQTRASVIWGTPEHIATLLSACYHLVITLLTSCYHLVITLLSASVTALSHDKTELGHSSGLLVGANRSRGNFGAANFTPSREGYRVRTGIRGWIEYRNTFAWGRVALFF